MRINLCYIFLLVIFISCSSKDRVDWQIQHSYIARQGMVSDTIRVIEKSKLDTTIVTYLNSALDTILDKTYFNDYCIDAKGGRVSKVHFYQKIGEEFIPEVFLVPLENDQVSYEIYMKILDLNRDDSSEVGPVRISEEFIAGMKFTFKHGGDYIWYMDLFVKDSCMNVVYHNKDSLLFNMDSTNHPYNLIIQ